MKAKLTTEICVTKILYIAATMSTFLFASCSRPISCLGKKCETRIDGAEEPQAASEQSPAKNNGDLTSKKFQILAGIDAIENGIRDILTPEAIKVQIEVKEKLFDLEMAREQGDKNKIQSTIDRMKNLVTQLLVADKNLLNSLIDQLKELSLSMAEVEA